MTSRIAAVTFDCENAAALAEFWSGVLGRPVNEVQPEASGFFASIGGFENSETGPMLMFIKVSEGKTAKNRVHLDLAAEDRASEVERLIALGATRLYDKDEWGVSWTTLIDPEGNEFCVAQH